MGNPQSVKHTGGTMTQIEQASFIEDMPFHFKEEDLRTFPRFVLVAYMIRGWWKIHGGFQNIEAARAAAQRLGMWWRVRKIYELKI
jgi:hypothetical protein